ncbi:hypothetical protein FGRMN_6517 [Fusarium graminum]|nr:hypothetical protein FGRMN_6517 [Fusarium graminum]
MHSFVQKYGPVLSTLIVRAFTIAKRNNRQLTYRESQIMNEASNAIIPNLVGTIGLNSIEFEVLVCHAAMIDPEEQLDFLNAAVEIIKSTRPEECLTEYDQSFLNFVAQLLEALSNTQQINQSESVLPVPSAAESIQASPQELASLNDALLSQPQSLIQTVSVGSSMISESSISSCHSISSVILSTNTLMHDHIVDNNLQDRTASLQEAPQMMYTGISQAPGDFNLNPLLVMSETGVSDEPSQDQTTDCLDWNFLVSESDQEADLQALIQSINEVNVN